MRVRARKCIASSMPKRSREAAEKALLAAVRAEGLVNAEQRGRPIVLCRDAAFIILYNGSLQLLEDVDCKTLSAFRRDIHGSYSGVLDCDNLTAKQLVVLARLLGELEALALKSSSLVETAAAELAPDAPYRG